MRVLQITAEAPATEGCHTIELLVALNFELNHTPTGPGDRVTWFYTCNDIQYGCKIYVGDSGTDAALLTRRGAD